MKLLYQELSDTFIRFREKVRSIREFHRVFCTVSGNDSIRKYSFLYSRRHMSQKCSGDKPPWRILFFGSDKFAVKTLQSLCSKFRTDTLISRLDVCTTWAQDWKKQYNPVYKFAEQENLKLLEWPLSDHEYTDRYDVGVLVSFGYLLPEELIRSFPLGIMNVHSSLLPRWRGAAPTIRAIMNGDTETGVTIMKISPHEFDIGEIIRQYTVQINPDETTVTLDNRLADLGARLLMECIRDLPRSVRHSVPQSNENATYAKKITQATAIVNWSKKTAEEVYNLHRAIFHVFPLVTYWSDIPIKLLDVKLDEISGMNPENQKKTEKLNSDENIFPGLVEFSRRRSLLRIQCKDGKWVCVNSVLVSGKKKHSASEFYNGFLSKRKNSLERRFDIKKVD